MMIVLIVILLLIILTLQFRSDLKKAYERLARYPVSTIQTSLGIMNYVERGKGPALILSHGLFGGYDQGSASLQSLLGDHYHQIAVSRFGYLGSDVPKSPTPAMQAQAYCELLDHLKIDKAYIIGTSAGGASSLQFALNYPQRTKGLILLSSGAPDKPRSQDQLKEIGMTGPPSIFIHNFPIWISLKYFGFIFNSLFGGKGQHQDLLETMLPVKERRPGIQIDTKYTNTDMTLHYSDYAVERLTCPILVLHAKDDPMAKYENIELLLHRIQAKAVIYEDGGHLLEGKNAGQEIINFIEETS